MTEDLLACLILLGLIPVAFVALVILLPLAAFYGCWIGKHLVKYAYKDLER